MNNKKTYATIVVLALIAFAVFYFGRGGKPDEVIPSDSPVLKTQDEVNTIKQGSREVVQVRFSWEVQGIKYNDALYIPKDQYGKLTAEDIEKLKKQRFDNWVKTINQSSNSNEEL